MRTIPENRRGITLLELIVVLVVLAALLGASVPAIGRQINQARVQNAALVVAGDLEQAFSLAARARRPVRISFDAGARLYVIEDRDGVELRRRSFGATSDLEVSSISPSVAVLDVFPNGIASGPITVSLVRAGHTATVTMTRAGRVRVTS